MAKKQNQDYSFDNSTSFAIMVIMGNEKTKAMLSIVGKDMSESEFASFVKFVASMIILSPELRKEFLDSTDGNNVLLSVSDLVNEICKELHLWQYSEAFMN